MKTDVLFNATSIFQAPIESIPVDCGWIGFVLIFVNGFLLSYVLAGDGVDTTERLLLSIGLGFGIIFVVMILIGVLWEFSLLTIILTQVILLVTLFAAAINRGLKPNFNGFLWIKQKNGRVTKLNILHAILLIVISIYVIAAVYKTVSLPATDWDSLAYGVNYAKIIFEKGNIPLIAGPSIGLEMSASYPPGVQLTAVYLYSLAGNANDFYYRVLSPIFGLATMITVYKFAMIASKNKTISVFAVFTLSAIPVFWELFIQETYFMGLTCMLTLSTLFFSKAYNSNYAEAKKHEILGTLFCCFSTLTSYIGLFSFGLLLLYAINRRVSAKRFACLTTLALFVILPWYARNFILLGNPIYPFFGIGNYLDPLLRNSTVQHFQNYTTIPLYAWTSTICKLGAGILVLAIACLTIAKRKNFLERKILEKNFLVILPLYLLFVGVTIMALHLPFPRYLIIVLPSLAVIFSTAIKSLLTMRNLACVIAVTLISLVVISSTAMLPCMNSAKPTRELAGDKWSYLSHVFEEADAWNWINENTPKDARIATYDIKEYYIERDVLPLDGNEAAPLYKINTIEEGINFLKEKNVSYFLSVPWATPSETRMPPAYEWSVLTKYLGDPKYLPPVYVGRNGTAVYHVGPIQEEIIYASFAEKDFAPPIKHVTINLTVTSKTWPPSAKFYIPIPADYREGLMMASFNSSKHLVDVELWNRIISEKENASSLDKSKLVMKWPVTLTNSSGVENLSFVWQINRAGYFTFLIVDREETLEESFNVTLDLRFCNCWDAE